MEDNLKYALKELDIFSSRLTALDLIDGLRVGEDSFFKGIEVFTIMLLPTYYFIISFYVLNRWSITKRILF